ncbi:MAG: universal stress protein [Planctomycetota bacterium]
MKVARILLPTDFSPTAASAFEPAASLADRWGATIDLLHVLEDFPVLPAISFEHLPTLPSEAVHEQAEAQAQMQLANLLTSQLPVAVRGQARVERGSPAAEIIRCATQHGYDLIVMSTHGHTGLKHVVLGSVTQKVVQQAPCPVLSVRAPAD